MTSHDKRDTDQPASKLGKNWMDYRSFKGHREPQFLKQSWQNYLGEWCNSKEQRL